MYEVEQSELNLDLDLDLESDAKLDSSWITEFESAELDYKQYYKEDLQSIRLHCIYINRNNDIDKIKEEKVFMQKPNCLSRGQILSIIKKNNVYRNIKYTILSILKYNITLEPENLKTFIKSNSNCEFLTSIKNIDAIHFDKTISMFQDLNDLFIIFYEKDVSLYIDEKEFIKSGKIKTHSHDKNKTKKIILRPNTGKKYTIRKELKEELTL